MRELGLERLKIYNDQGIIVFSTESAQIGKPDRSPAFLRAIGVGGKTVVRKPQPDGTSLYELYVPLQVVGGEHKAVIELYEATGRLDSVLFSTLLPAIAVPGLLLILLFHHQLLLHHLLLHLHFLCYLSISLNHLIRVKLHGGHNSAVEFWHIG